MISIDKNAPRFMMSGGTIVIRHVVFNRNNFRHWKYVPVPDTQCHQAAVFFHNKWQTEKADREYENRKTKHF